MYFTLPQRLSASKIPGSADGSGKSFESSADFFAFFDLDGAAETPDLPVVNARTIKPEDVASAAGADRILLFTRDLRADYAKACEGRTALGALLKKFGEAGYAVEDALADKDGISLAIVIKKGLAGEEATLSKFVRGERLITLKFGARDDIMRVKSVISNDFYERYMLHDVAKRYKGGSIIDVGANIGNHSVFFADLLAPGAKLYSVEPNDIAFDLLSRNLGSNGLEDRVELHKCAAGASSGSVVMNNGSSANLGASKVISSVAGGEDGTPMRSIDTMIPEGVRFDVMKVDVEGFELDVFKGATRVLAENDLCVYAEAGAADHKSAIADFLSTQGYKPVAVFNDTPTYLFMKG